MQIDETRVDGSPDSFFVGVTPNGQVNLIFKNSVQVFITQLPSKSFIQSSLSTSFAWTLCKKIVSSLIRLEQLAVQQDI